MKFKTLIRYAGVVDGRGSPVRKLQVANTETGRLALIPPGADAKTESIRIQLREALEEDTIGLHSGLSARELNLKGHGLIAEVYMADLVLFDFQKMKGMATYDYPEQPDEGIEMVWVNGRPSYSGNGDGDTEGRSGRLIRRNTKPES